MIELRLLSKAHTKHTVSSLFLVSATWRNWVALPWTVHQFIAVNLCQPWNFFSQRLSDASWFSFLVKGNVVNAGLARANSGTLNLHSEAQHLEIGDKKRLFKHDNHSWSDSQGSRFLSVLCHYGTFYFHRFWRMKMAAFTSCLEREMKKWGFCAKPEMKRKELWLVRIKYKIVAAWILYLF